MKEQIIVQISVLPMGTSSPGVSHYIAACLEVLKRTQDVHYQLTAMGTLIQGPVERVLELVQQMHEAPFNMGAKRVLTTITIDDRRDRLQTMEEKVEAVLGK